MWKETYLNNTEENSDNSNFKTYIEDYCHSTSIHGLRYVGEKRSTFEKIWWIIVFIISLSTCLAAIYKTYKKWEESPVIVNLANKMTSIHTIPFPAVTICPETKFSSQKFNYTEQLTWPYNITEMEHLQYVHLLCKINSVDYLRDYLTFSEDFYEFIDNLKPLIEMPHCLYGIEGRICRDVFKIIFTDEGVCYTFNMIDRSDIFNENVKHYGDYHKMNKKNHFINYEYIGNDTYALDAYPYRPIGSGLKNGLRLKLFSLKADVNYACRSTQQGYKVLVHDPTEVPRPGEKFFSVPLGKSVTCSVDPSMIITSNTLQLYKAEDRGCYFQNERSLKYFQFYTLANCKMECLTNYTLRQCDCVGFFMPRENGTSICGRGKSLCMYSSESSMQKMEFAPELKHYSSSARCKCLPGCTELDYNFKTTQNDFAIEKLLPVDRNRFNPKYYDGSFLSIYFNSDRFLKLERNELYGPLDFLANFGGLLGLFAGFSVMSVIEILYFLSVRIICNKCLHNHWWGPRK